MKPSSTFRLTRRLAVFFAACAFAAPLAAPAHEIVSPTHAAAVALSFSNNSISDSFWSPRLKANSEASLQHNFKLCAETGRLANFANAPKGKQGKFQGIYYNDSDVYKLIEAVAYSLANSPDASLEKQMDDVIALIVAAQEPSGYLNTYYTIREPDKKWTNMRDRHELYCAGHLIEAAVAHKRVTGKDTLLRVAEKLADHIGTVFGPAPNQKHDVPGHEEIELALVKLGELTGKTKYFDLAKFFIDARGNKKLRGQTYSNRQGGGEYWQDHRPVREQDEVVGHAVRAVYLYSGMADIAARTGDAKLVGALDKLWDSAVNRKLAITGGIGARHSGEAFGADYELPNLTAYNETCAAVGLVFWAHRMNLLHGQAKYADVMERALYNGALSGVSLDGEKFFYVNPLESDGKHHRQPFFGTACCPPNIARLIASLPGYQYAIGKDGALVVNLLVSGEAKIRLPEGDVRVKMKTQYPWGADYTLNISLEKRAGAGGGNSGDKPFVVRVRAPGTGEYETHTFRWVTGKITINGAADLTVKRIVAHPAVTADFGRVALQRGPLVYCFEQVDNAVPVREIVLARDPKFRTEFRSDLLGGVTVITCKDAAGRDLVAVPYYAWDNRAPGAMAVWVRQQGLDKKLPLYSELALASDTPAAAGNGE